MCSALSRMRSLRRAEWRKARRSVPRGGSARRVPWGLGTRPVGAPAHTHLNSQHPLTSRCMSHHPSHPPTPGADFKDPNVMSLHAGLGGDEDGHTRVPARRARRPPLSQVCVSPGDEKLGGWGVRCIRSSLLVSDRLGLFSFVGESPTGAKGEKVRGCKSENPRGAHLPGYARVAREMNGKSA